MVDLSTGRDKLSPPFSSRDVVAETNVIDGLDPDRLEQISAELAKVALEARRSKHQRVRSRKVTAPQIRAMLRARQLRTHFFDAKLFADPAWD